MADVIPTSTNEAMAIVKASAPAYFRRASDLTFRRRLWLAMLKRYGQLIYNAESFATVWPVEYSQPEVRQYGDSGDQEFVEHDALLQLEVDVRGYTATDRLTKKKRLMNKGRVQIVDLYKEKSNYLIKSLSDKFCGELYIDGYAANNENRLIGLRSMMTADTANTVAGDLIAPPSATYGGLSCALQAQGGSWTSDLGAGNFPNAYLGVDYPYGSGSTEFDCVSPLHVNYTSTSWGTNQTTWLQNCENVLRFTMIAMASKGGDENVPKLFMLDAKMFNEFLNNQAAKQRIMVPHKEAQDLGFGRAMNFDGAAIHFEFDCPAGYGYGMDPSQMDVFSMESQLFVPDGPDWSMAKKSWLYEAGYFGNCRFQPKYFAELGAYK
jgi:hypothetical protein